MDAAAMGLAMIILSTGLYFSCKRAGYYYCEQCRQKFRKDAIFCHRYGKHGYNWDAGF